MAKTMPIVDDEMHTEYDFAGGVRGKHYQVLREEGYVVRIYNDDGTVTERRVAGERVVILEPDVYEYFPNNKKPGSVESAPGNGLPRVGR